ncbi:MAG: CCA-adding enzyme [Chlamydiia bacterium]|nr:CCA-adding enzyme [Chlamydiia bacterium]
MLYDLVMNTYEAACSVIQKLKNKGHIAFFAGGWVRDFLMDHTSDDIDIATDANVETVQSIFEKTIPVGIQFGIVIVVEGKHHFEVATFRKDCGYEDGRRPIGIEKASPEEDASRRDFTINGMFYDPLTETLYDYTKGQEDIQNKAIRAIGNPHQRFIEDRLRMIRAARYACRFSFTIEPKTKEAIIAHANSLFPAVAIERVWQEFSKMSRFGKFDAFLLKLHKLHLLQTIFESLKDTSYEEIQKRLKPLQSFPENAPVLAKVLELFPNFSLDDKMELCSYLKLSNEDRTFLKYYEKVMSTYAKSGDSAHSVEPIDWAYLYADEKFSLCLKMAVAHLPKEERSDTLSNHENKKLSLENAIVRIQDKKPLVTSKHLMSEGIIPGQSMGKLLKEAERISINEKIDDPNDIILKLKKSPFWP